ncbi:MAG: hypothetical protein P1V51_08140 [Deltaproteobacteria bacterium]|nr:hypothetical protein [Deltaproteobacteria bacterium]
MKTPDLSLLSLLVLTLLAPSAAAAAGEEDEGLSVRAAAELGYLGVLSHEIQLDSAGTLIDYKAEGGQEVLFPVSRLSLELGLNARHRLVFLYQPLRIETVNVLPRDLVIQEATFAAGTPVRFVYGFPFWRASWLYDFAPGAERELAFGISLQLRNATINFESLDGALTRTNRDLGPVPILKGRWRRPLGRSFFVGAEADGFYAPISYINGSDNEVVGAILDASVRGGVVLEEGPVLFLNLRYLGGGSVGTGTPDGAGDGYLKNWLHFFTVTVGASYDLAVRC